MNTIRVIVTRFIELFNYNPILKKEAIKEDEPVFMTLKEAKQDPALVNEIYSQINNAKLTIGSSNNYVAGIQHKNNQHYILATQKEWESFFGEGPVCRKTI